MPIKPFEVQVRFSDLDLLGHVNNVIYLSYFEMARIHYFHPLLGDNWDWQKEGIVLVNNQVTYKKPIYLHDKPIITIHVTNIGTKSFTIGYEVIVNNENRASGTSTLVCFDNRKQISIEIPLKMKEALKQFAP